MPNLSRAARTVPSARSTSTKANIPLNRSSDPVPAMLALFGTLPVCPAGWTLTRCALLSGLSVPRNAERIAAFLHDLAAAL